MVGAIAVRCPIGADAGGWGELDEDRSGRCLSSVTLSGLDWVRCDGETKRMNESGRDRVGEEGASERGWGGYKGESKENEEKTVRGCDGGERYQKRRNAMGAMGAVRIRNRARTHLVPSLKRHHISAAASDY